VRGATFKRCGCRDDAGHRLGANCLRLKARGHGSWYYQAALPAGPTGSRRRQRKGGFVTQRAAEVALTDLLDRVNKRTHVDAGRQTVEAYLTGWLAGKAVLRSTTARSYAEHIRLYLVPGLGHLRLTELTTSDIEDLYGAMRALGRPGSVGGPPGDLAAHLLSAREVPKTARPLTAARIRRVHATLRSALNAAVKRRLIPFNPAVFVELAQGARPRPALWTAERVEAWHGWDLQRRTAERQLKQATHKAKMAGRRVSRRPLDLAAQADVQRAEAALARIRTLADELRASYALPKVALWTPEQTGTFLDRASADRLYALYHLIVFRGLRRGEAIGLKWTDVGLDRGELAVNGQIVQLGYATEEARPKSGSEGTIALDHQTVAVLRAHRERQDLDRRAWKEEWRETGLVFTREDGTALHPEYVSRHFDWLLRTAELPPIRLHDLRHGAATLALAGGANLKVVSQMLRHSSITITADTYTSVLPDVARQAAEAAIALVPRAGVRPGSAADQVNTGAPHGPHQAPPAGPAARDASKTAGQTGGPPGDRTRNPRIKSPLLCQLS